MGILELIFVIAILGLLVWLITTLIPMPDQFKQVIFVLAAIAVLIYILQAFGMNLGLPHVRLWK